MAKIKRVVSFDDGSKAVQKYNELVSNGVTTYVPNGNPMFLADLQAIVTEAQADIASIS